MKWIYHKRKARVIYSLTTDPELVIKWTTNHLLARLHFDSNTQKTTKISFGCFQFSTIHRKEIPPKAKTVIEAFTAFHQILMQENHITPSIVREIKTDATKPIKMTSH